MHTHRLLSILGGFLAAVSVATQPVSAATDTWTGSGADNTWTNALNWGVFAPSPGDFLSWGSGQTTSSNTFPTGTVFGNITFKPGAASFTLTGNQIVLTNLYDIASGLVLSPGTAYGSISNNSASAQFVNLPVEFMNGYHYIATTNGNLNIGETMTRDTGAVITFYTPGSGKINLTGSGLVTNNFNNLLGGWAVLNNTNWATLDVNSNVFAFTNYTINNSGGIDTITNGTSLNYRTLGTAPVVASGGATINSLQIYSPNGSTGNTTAGTITFANNSDVLRLGQNGGIMLANSYVNNNNGGNWIVGSAIGNGIITAGTNGNNELFFCEANDVSSAGGQLTMNSVIADNGSGKVTVVKNGGQNLVFAANNTYSGGTYINQSRISATIAGAYGYGPIFVNNGGQLWVRANVNFTNDVYLSGSGNGESQQFGAVRLNGSASCILSGTIHVNVATPKISNSGTINGQITGSAGMRFSSAKASGTSPTIIGLGNTNNNYAGDTIIWADGFNIFLRMGNSLVIPNGAGTGNLILTNNSAHNAYFDLNGFNETVNGLISAPGTAANDFVTNNNSAVVSTLTVGGNNATATFGGNIGVGNGKVALTKIGTGTETLSGANSYTGNTAVNGGTLVLSGSGSISNSANVYLNGGTFDISGLPGSSTTVQPLFMTNAALTVLLNPSVTNITTTTLTTGGTNNFINIVGVTGLSGAAYPTNFTLIKYTTFASNSFFGFGTLVAPTIQGYFTNTGSAIVMVLTNGPKPLVWKGNDLVNPTFWDVATTTNWQFNGVSAVPFNMDDSVTFDDTASTFNVNVTTVLSPGAITVTNATHNYTFSGAGSINGFGGLIKQGGDSLTLQESGDSFSGGVNVTGGSVTFAGNNTISGGITIANGATVQVGNNTGTGTLPSGSVADNGSLLFDVGANLSVPGSISGSGTVTNEAAGILNLSGVNTFTGALNVQQGTLQMGGPGALGAPANGVLIASGATLDVNSFSAGSLGVSVGGQGVGNNGAIVNNGAAQQNALQQVTNTASTTFGGTGRWDIRSANVSDPSQGILSTGGNAYNLTKTGVNQVSLVGITVDSALANIDIQQGILSVESATTGLGNPSGTLTVESGATLQLYQLTSSLDKNFVFNGNGVVDTLYAAGSTSSSQNTIQTATGSVTLNGACNFDVASGGVLNIAGNTVTGSGSLTQVGAGTLTMTANSSYTGNTIINGGDFILNGNNSGGGTLSAAAGTILAGAGGNTGPVIVAGNIEPGSSIPATGANQIGTISSGPLTLTNATLTLDLQTGGGDLIAVTGNLILSGTNSIQPVPVVGNISAGQQITIITYTGTLTGTTNNFVLLPAAIAGYNFSLVDPATTPGFIKINVDHVPANKLWQGGALSAPNTWDINITTNWYNQTTSTPGVVFTAGDAAIFDDSATTNMVSLTGSINTVNVIMNNSSLNYTFTGAGSLTGVGGLTLNGSGTLVLANSGTNNFTGPITINNGSLVIGAGGTNGNVGLGVITNNANFSFNRSDAALTVPNNIVGFGSISNVGTGIVTLSGNNTNFFALDYLAQGTLRVTSSTALGNTNGSVLTILNGATLDVTTNSVNLGALPIYVSGAGVSNNGAIVNNGLNTAVGTNLANVIMQGDTTFGGTGRLDFRSTPVTANNATLDTSFGNPYNLTKTGTNQFWLSGVNVGSSLGNIIITNGLMGIEAGTTFGNTSYNLTVCNNATLNFYNLSNVLSKNLVLNDGSTVASTSGINTFGGSIAMAGINTFNVTSGDLALTGAFSGSGGTLIKSGGAVLSLYSIPSSAVFDLAGGTLDITNAGGTLNLGLGQTIRGSATLGGNLTDGSGATMSPGETSTNGTLTCLGNATFGGTNLMKLNKSVSLSNDVLNVTGTLTYGGILNVTNVGPALAVGDSFKLFNAVSYSGNFATTNLPSSATWNWNPANGTLTVLTVVPTGPGTFTNPTSITNFSLSGANIVISGTNGQSGDAYYLLQSTNVAKPLSQWNTVGTDVLSANGAYTITYTNVVVPGDRQQFYILSDTNYNP